MFTSSIWFLSTYWNSLAHIAVAVPPPVPFFIPVIPSFSNRFCPLAQLLNNKVFKVRYLAELRHLKSILTGVFLATLLYYHIYL